MDIEDWCQQNRLSPEVVKLLRIEGFSDAEQLRGLTDDDIRITFHQRHGLLLYQFTLLRRSLKELQEGHVSKKEKKCESIQELSESFGLDPETIRTLEEEGFRTTSDLTLITSDDIRVAFQASGRLSLQQCLALRETLTSSSAQQPNDGGHKSICRKKDKDELGSKKMSTKHKKSLKSLQPASRSNVSSSQKGPEIHLLVAGSEKSGKTSTIISLLGEQEEKGRTFYTGICDGRTLKVVESSDWLKPEKETQMIISCELEKLDPRIHAIVFTVDISSRFTQASSLMYSYLKAIFTKYLPGHLIVVFTFGDRLQDAANKILDLLKDAPKDLRQVLEDCNNRYIIFNNTVTNDDVRKSQCTELLGCIEEVSRTQSKINGGFISLQDLCYGEKNLNVGISKRIDELRMQFVEDSPFFKTQTNELMDRKENIKRRKKRLEKGLKTKHEIQIPPF